MDPWRWLIAQTENRRGPQFQLILKWPTQFLADDRWQSCAFFAIFHYGVAINISVQRGFFHVCLTCVLCYVVDLNRTKLVGQFCGIVICNTSSKARTLVGVALAYSQNRQVNIQTKTSEQVTGSPTTLGVIWTQRGTLSLVQYPALDPSSFLLLPRETHWSAVWWALCLQYQDNSRRDWFSLVTL